MTSASLSPSRAQINGWDSNIEIYAREMQQRFISLERLNNASALKLQKKIKYLHYFVCFVGIMVGTLGVVNTMYSENPPMGIKVAQLALGYIISAASYILSNSDMNKKLEDATKAYTLCIHSKNSIGLIIHMPRNERPDAESYLKKISSDLECIEGLCIYASEPKEVVINVTNHFESDI